MKKKLFALIFLVFYTLVTNAQHASVSGVVTDTLNKQNLPNSVVSVLKAKDSVLVQFVRAGKGGKFALKDLPSGKFVLMVSYPSYADYVYALTLSDTSKEEVGEVKMTLKSRLLEEVLVRQKIAAVRLRGDTIEYNADSFKVREGASVEEMLKKMPGLQVDKDGKITAQGEKVEKVLVDGEEFFWR